MPAIARAALLWVHLAGVVTWMGAVAYYLLILRPSIRRSGIARADGYALLRAVKARLRRVVGGAVTAVVLSGAMLAHARGLLRWGVWGDGYAGRIFAIKLCIAALLVLIFATALPIIARIRTPRRRARAFVWTHGVVLLLGATAAFLGLLLHG
jgi:uncharacterized membrane protein